MFEELAEVVNDNKGTVLDLIIDFIFGGTSDKLKAVKTVLVEQGRISDVIFWNNFSAFLRNCNYDVSKLRKLSILFEEQGNKRSTALILIKAIDDIDSEEKARCLANLTQSVINSEINVENYFRIFHTLRYLVKEDLNYISKSINGATFVQDIHLDDYIIAGIIRQVDGGYVYTERAYDLVEFGICRGEHISRPSQIKTRPVVALNLDDSLFNS